MKAILVIEDDPEMNRFIVDTLSSQYRVATAFDGREGLQKAKELQPDVILSDLMMPRMNGEQFLTELRRQPDFDDVPVLLLTAKADDELRLDLLRRGAQDYLLKPFSAEELRGRVSNFLAMRKASQVLQKELASS